MKKTLLNKHNFVTAGITFFIATLVAFVIFGATTVFYFSTKEIISEPKNIVFNSDSLIADESSLETLNTAVDISIVAKTGNVQISAEKTRLKEEAVRLAAEAKAAEMQRAKVVEFESMETLKQVGNRKILLFFYADWCKYSKPLNAEIMSNQNQIPSNLVFIKVNSDKFPAIRKNYNAPGTPYFIRVNSSGGKINDLPYCPNLGCLLSNV